MKGITVPDQEREERRLRRRYRVSTLAQYRWQDSTGGWVSDSGVTADISVAGVYVLAASSPPTGAPIEMRVALPAKSISTARGWLFGKGVVTRVKDDVGFAAKIDLRMLRGQRAASNSAE